MPAWNNFVNKIRQSRGVSFSEALREASPLWQSMSAEQKLQYDNGEVRKPHPKGYRVNNPYSQFLREERKSSKVPKGEFRKHALEMWRHMSLEQKMMYCKNPKKCLHALKKKLKAGNPLTGKDKKVMEHALDAAASFLKELPSVQQTVKALEEGNPLPKLPSADENLGLSDLGL